MIAFIKSLAAKAVVLAKRVASALFRTTMFVVLVPTVFVLRLPVNIYYTVKEAIYCLFGGRDASMVLLAASVLFAFVGIGFACVTFNVAGLGIYADWLPVMGILNMIVGHTAITAVVDSFNTAVTYPQVQAA